ncbi:MAG: hypothetical protein K6E63_07225 [Lachnospiraceae bacterium]|nr:hypothetical protein [Lachnospiraceae bacterium]
MANNALDALAGLKEKRGNTSTTTQATASNPDPKPKAKDQKSKKTTVNKPKKKTDTPKKSNAGRKAIPDEEKKKQITLTIKPESSAALSECDADYKKLLSRYIDKNIDTIVEELKKL